MARRVKCSVAAVIRDAAGRVLAVRRPPDDDRLPDVWGLPAATLMGGELPEQAIRRLGREKLGAELEPLRLLGVKSGDRGEYELILMDIEAAVIGGSTPDVSRATTTATRYVEQRWTADLALLEPAAALGSLCCQILLERGAPGG